MELRKRSRKESFLPREVKTIGERSRKEFLPLLPLHSLEIRTNFRYITRAQKELENQLSATTIRRSQLYETQNWVRDSTSFLLSPFKEGGESFVVCRLQEKKLCPHPGAIINFMTRELRPLTRHISHC